MKLRRMMTRFYFSTKLKTLPEQNHETVATSRVLQASNRHMTVCRVVCLSLCLSPAAFLSMDAAKGIEDREVLARELPTRHVAPETERALQGRTRTAGLIEASTATLVAASRFRLAAREQDAIRRAADENAAKRGNCRLFPSWRYSAYVLPWARGQAFVVTRTWDHFLRANGGVGLYAIDVPMPIGTTIVAVRAGRVVAVREEFADGNGEDLKENFVFIRHADGTIARYFHLTRNGALVDVGDDVGQGQPIALSGNTGDSAGPHLHFDVQVCGPNLPPNYNALPCGQTIPVTFRNTTSNPCGLMVGERYEATTAAPLTR